MVYCNTFPQYAFIVENLIAGYEGRSVLYGANLKLLHGEKCILTGSNGAGKTTLLRVLLGLHPVSDGRIVFYNDRADTRNGRRCAYVNQHMVNASVPFSTWEVAAMGTAGVRVPHRDAELRIARGLDEAGALVLKRKPYNELSGGQKQRVQIARCLIQGAEILLLDEPLASLDPEAKESLVSTLTRLSKTVLVVSHEHDRFRESKWRFRVLENGKISP
jgi:ABC-type Mn2+/Zn2+ transport system ATPase subunit